MEKIIKICFILLYVFIYGFGFIWAAYYYPSIMFTDLYFPNFFYEYDPYGWIYFAGLVIFSWGFFLALKFAGTEDGFVKIHNAKFWTYIMTLPFLLYSAVVILISILNWVGVIVLVRYFMGVFTLILLIMSLFYIPMMIGFHFFYMKSIGDYTWGRKMRNRWFGITAILLCVHLLVVFGGQYLGFYNVLGW